MVIATFNTPFMCLELNFGGAVDGRYQDRHHGGTTTGHFFNHVFYFLRKNGDCKITKSVSKTMRFKEDRS